MSESKFVWTAETRRQWFRDEMFGRCGLTEDDLVRLDVEGYFAAPSSRRRHGAYIGGGFDHQYEVTQFLVNVTDKGLVKWCNPRSPYVVGMFHDLCKNDEFKAIWCKDDPTALTPKEYVHNENVLLKGHGDKSVMLASLYLTLTEEEMLCIRYHMGAYETNDWEQFDAAIRKYPSVLWTHTADMYAAKVVGI